MERKTTLVVGEMYHIYNRGVNRADIFMTNYDKDRFIKLLYLCNGTKPVVFKDLPQGLPLGEVEKGDSLVDIGVYCLMSNHFHLLIYEKVKGGASKFMEKLSTGYSMYFNKKNERTGPLFEGRFKIQHVDNDPYLNYLFSYIHLNPVKLIDSKWKENGIFNVGKVEKYIKDYHYSSYIDYFIKEREESAILNKTAFPDSFSELENVEDLLKEFRENLILQN